MFHSWRSGSRDIYVMPLDGGPVQRLTSTSRQEWLPSWSPDGSAVAFGDAAPPGALWIVRRAAGGSWDQPRERVRSGVVGPAWSPDSRLLVYSTDPADRKGGGKLALVPVDSGEVRILVDSEQPGQPRAERPEFSEDGRDIYFKGDSPTGNTAIYSIPVTGGPPRPHLRFDDPARSSYAWALGRRRIYFTIEDRQSDLWVAEIAAQR